MTRAKPETTMRRFLGFKYVRVGSIRQVSFRGWLLFSQIGNRWAFCLERHHVED
jgi:hypothetical protein